MIRLKKINYFLGGRLILKNIDLEIKPGEKILLMGENGGGKSTLLRLLTKSYPRAHFQNSFKSSFYLADDFYIPTFYYARSYLIRMAGIFNSTADIDSMMEILGLKNQRIYALSKGNRQKVGIILGLISRAEIIYFDEALDGLDAKTIMALIDLFKKAHSTIVIVTHYPDLFKSYSFKRYLVKEGRISELI